MHTLSIADTQAQAWDQAQPCGRCADEEMRYREVLHLWVLSFLGLTGVGAGLWPKRLAFFHRGWSWATWSWMRPWVPGLVLGFCFNKPFYNCSLILHVHTQNAFLVTLQEPMTLWKYPISTSNTLAGTSPYWPIFQFHSSDIYIYFQYFFIIIDNTILHVHVICWNLFTFVHYSFKYISYPLFQFKLHKNPTW